MPLMRKSLTSVFFTLAAAVLVGVFFSVKDNPRFRLDLGRTPLELVEETSSGKSTSPTKTDIAAAVATSTLENPEYIGRDASGRVWKISASRATQMSSTSSSSLELTDVAAFLNDDAHKLDLNFTAPRGMLNNDTEVLTLSGGVRGTLNRP
ncbi:MAG: hypothetical protein COY40_00905 [Alphaproteobacteria bacterium CG_4_10_14_0_8_um_filter_53_9]|nr:MAG: hypothetical protein COY40_00905 [Alphaproteobacteria bacterium CG_4_10_14_0_8_um_filter_53_9]